MMKLLNKIGVFAMMAIVIVASLVQFHHHDCEGRIFLKISNTTDLIIDDNGTSVDNCNHDKRHPHKCHGEASCSMHIDEQDITQCVSAVPPLSPARPIIMPAPIKDTYNLTLSLYNGALHNWQNHDIKQHLMTLIIRCSVPFRAPTA